jgi:Lon protease-like protein
VTGRLPLFPLGTVLFPGLVLPLHIFEERYRALVRHLVGLPDGTPREFGVVAISSGWTGDGPTGPTVGGAVGGGGGLPGAESGRPPGTTAGGLGGPPELPTGRFPAGLGPRERSGADEGAGVAPGGPVTLHEVGCTAEVRQVTELPDGRFNIVTVGRRRFRIVDLDKESQPYLTAAVEWLPEPDGEEEVADLLAPRVLAVFRQYLGLIRADPEEISEQLPDDPTVISHLVAATAALTMADRQRLLAIPDTAGRLRAELRLLSREAALLRQVRAVPVSPADFGAPPTPN